MERHDNPEHRVLVLKALLSRPLMWMDPVCVSQLANGVTPRRARVELRALRREGRVARCGRGRFHLGANAAWARDHVQAAECRAEAARLRQAASREQTRRVLAGELPGRTLPPRGPSCVEVAGTRELPLGGEAGLRKLFGVNPVVTRKPDDHQTGTG